MRTRGRIKFWNDEKGFGFITPASGAKQVFVHIKAFGNRSQRPVIGQLVTFSLSTDRQGRPCAVRVTRVGEKSPGEIKRNDSLLLTAGAVLFLVIVGLCVLGGWIPVQVLVAYLLASVVSYVAYAWDKSSAERGAWRTSESALHWMALIGGWPGALVAQQKLRHKTRKNSFRAVFWFTVILNCGLFLWLFTASGSAVLESLISIRG
jgi:uncharacterized membrane protein YsdA (DUF1294 family)/cold shock CspA family protein